MEKKFVRDWKSVYDIAAREMLELKEMKEIFRKWNIDFNYKDGFIGEYLDVLYDLGKAMMMRSLAFTECHFKYEGTTQMIHAFSDESIAMSVGNLDWYLLKGFDLQDLWVALHNKDVEKTEIINVQLPYAKGKIGDVQQNYSLNFKKYPVTDENMYEMLIRAVTLHKYIEEEFRKVGLEFRYECGTIGEHFIHSINFITTTFMVLLDMYTLTFTDTTTWKNPIDFDVLYPCDNDIRLSMLSEDFDEMLMALDNKDAANNIWLAFKNKDNTAIDWLNKNISANIGPVKHEEDTDG